MKALFSIGKWHGSPNKQHLLRICRTVNSGSRINHCPKCRSMHLRIQELSTCFRASSERQVLASAFRRTLPHPASLWLSPPWCISALLRSHMSDEPFDIASTLQCHIETLVQFVNPFFWLVCSIVAAHYSRHRGAAMDLVCSATVAFVRRLIGHIYTSIQDILCTQITFAHHTHTETDASIVCSPFERKSFVLLLFGLLFFCCWLFCVVLLYVRKRFERAKSNDKRDPKKRFK